MKGRGTGGPLGLPDGSRTTPRPVHPEQCTQSSAPRVPPAVPPLQQLTVSPPSTLWPHCVLTDPHHTPRLCHTPMTRPYTRSSSPICVCPPCPGLPVHTSSPRRTLIPICLHTLWVRHASHAVRPLTLTCAVCCVCRVHRTASGNRWPLACPRNPQRFASSIPISSRKPPSPSSDCLSTMASWAEG